VRVERQLGYLRGTDTDTVIVKATFFYDATVNLRRRE
jgi:hypothetical protein